MSAYYSEYDANAAAWLRELIKQGHIADGEVDERDLWDVAPDDIRGFTQVHLCAGIGVWSYALRRAGWPDDRPIWTGSFPCQPFSAAGKGLGFADERHLWPAGHWLIAQCRPAVVFGEQVASKDAEPWLDLVQADLEALAYAVGAVPFPSAGIGAPHIRDRLYWVADAAGIRGRQQSRSVSGSPSRGEGKVAGQGDGNASGANGATLRLADASGAGLQGGHRKDADTRRWEEASRHSGPRSAAGGLADAAGSRREPRKGDARVRAADDGAEPTPEQLRPARSSDRHGAPGPTNGLWRDADWLFCRDGKWRPVEPGTFPLAHGAPARVGRLRGYGNAINAEAAVAFIESYLEARGETDASAA